MFKKMENDKSVSPKQNVETPLGLKPEKNQSTNVKVSQPLPNTPSKMKKNSRKSVKTRSNAISTPSKVQKMLKSSRIQNTKPKNEILRGKFKDPRLKSKNVQDIRNFFESGAENRKKENVQKVHKGVRGGRIFELSEGSSRGVSEKKETYEAQLVLDHVAETTTTNTRTRARAEQTLSISHKSTEDRRRNDQALLSLFTHHPPAGKQKTI